MSTHGFDEAAAWSSARDGDAQAFASLYDRHRDRVFGHALRLVREPHDAEDVTAVVFLEAWRKRASVRLVEGSVIGWLLVTTTYTVRNHTRSLRRYRSALAKLPPAASQDDHAPGVDEAIDATGRERRMREAFARLSKRDQDVISLCILEELTAAQAAEALGVPEGTVKSRLSRARKRLSELAAPLADDTTILEGGAR
ncbi:sigma-70 family RNA polymerase sigma factor [Diaminobutyricibacter tongyongensis]|uniref:Sigma-70 family RNA polymerase sigma factor n=1 Tax=Leifsonia tongyongensis TaxID=1268043 RepID=A0A6L9XZQ2_9MICO|nr:sigma-70 family RNA polymerase sigma factor [Diaminobutyricibacter tongyongensis]NEN06912.1 sigma-70 family RNA polymerase sigma factor [Diaminobutyricibacter tongyongensis]